MFELSKEFWKQVGDFGKYLAKVGFGDVRHGRLGELRAGQAGGEGRRRGQRKALSLAHPCLRDARPSPGVLDIRADQNGSRGDGGGEVDAERAGPPPVAECAGQRLQRGGGQVPAVCSDLRLPALRNLFKACFGDS